MQTRKPVVAGQFYPAQHDSCLAEIAEFIEEANLNILLPETIAGGIVPHAGWIFSGSLATMVFLAIKQQHEKVHTFVLFGATHSYYGSQPAVYDRGVWLSPLGQTVIDEELSDAVLTTDTAVADPEAHRNEHSIEVQIPFIQHFFAGARILPILVPPNKDAIKLGDAVGKIVNQNQDKKIVCIGSTDLTHYGPSYGFTPVGTGPDALQWVNQVNDKDFIDSALKLEPEKMLSSAAEKSNSCGPGAASATVSAVKKQGREEGVLLAHTNSNEIMIRKMGSSSTESVGYAAIVF